MLLRVWKIREDKGNKTNKKKGPEISLMLKFNVAFIFSDLYFENVF